LLLVIASFATLPLKWGEFFSTDALRSTRDFLHGFAPPELAPFLMKVGMATLKRWPCRPSAR
jgi:phosphonate transport system permease protein